MRALISAVAGSLLFAIIVLGIYQHQSHINFDFNGDAPAGVLTGFYPSERGPDRVSYAWTHQTFGATLQGLDRRVAWNVTIRFRAARPDGAEADVAEAVDGRVQQHVSAPSDYVDHTFVVNARTDGGLGAHLSWSVVPTFVPKGDPRELGVMVDWIRVDPTGFVWPPRTVWRSAAPLLIVIVAVALAGLDAAPTAIIILLFSFSAAIIVTAAFGAFEALPTWPIAVASLLTAAVAALAVIRRRTLSMGGRLVVTITLVVTALKLLVLFHPQMQIGDAMFHAHRYEGVLRGGYYFTSEAPGGYSFPYPIGLYLFAWPFSFLTTNTTQHIAVLRIVVTIVDALAAVLLYRFVMNWRRDEATAVAAVVAYHLLPLSFSVITTGNLTNVFAQSLALVALVLTARVASSAYEPTPAQAPMHKSSTAMMACWIGLAGVSCAAFLSHTSTFAVLSVQLVLTSAAILCLAGRRGRLTGVILLGVTAAAIVIAFVVYYSHFMDLYRATWVRAAAETGKATAAAGGRTPMTRLLDVPRMLNIVYGLPMMGFAAVGAFNVIRRDRSSTAIVAGAWMVACVIFLILGIITPVDMRHYLAAVPIVAALSAIGFVIVWRKGTLWSIAAGAAALWACWIVGASWYGVMN